MHIWDRDRRIKTKLREHMVEEGMISREQARLSHAMEHGLFPTPPADNNSTAATTGLGIFDIFQSVRDAVAGARNGPNNNSAANAVANNAPNLAALNTGNRNNFDDSKQKAKYIQQNVIRGNAQYNALVSDFWITYRDSFTPVEFGGELNMDIQSNTHVTLSVDFVESLRSKEHFKRLTTVNFISTAAFVDLCRCPVAFIIPDSALSFLASMTSRNMISHKDEPLFGKWMADNQIDIVDNTTYDFASMVYDLQGAALKGALMQLRSCFILSRELSIDRNQREALSAYFDMDFIPWIELVMQNIPDSMQDTLKDPHDREDFIKDIIQMCYPPPSVSSCINENIQSMHIGTDNNHKAQRMDMYYANLVHGASIKVPLSEIWRPDNEMEHSEYDTNEFFRVMWKGLEQVLVQARAIPVTAQSSSGRRANNAVPAVVVSVGATSMAEYTDTLMQSINRSVFCPMSIES